MWWYSFLERQDIKMSILGWLEASWAVKLGLKKPRQVFSISCVGIGDVVRLWAGL